MPSVQLISYPERLRLSQLDTILGTISKRLSPEILLTLHGRTGLRFNDLRRHLGLKDTKTLSRALSSLAQSGFVERSVYGFRPPAVVYSLTALGEKSADALNTLLEVVEKEKDANIVTMN